MSQTRLGSCFGFAIVSDLAFSFLRNGGGDTLEIVERDLTGESPGGLVANWTGPPERPFTANLHRIRDEYRLQVDDEGWFAIDAEAGRITVPPASDFVRREQRLWGYPAVLCFQRRGDLAIHAAAIDIDGSVAVLAAPGRAGKTTLAAAFLQAGYRVLAEDMSCCREGSPPVLFPGPALLRVRPDVFPNLSPGLGRVVAEDAGRVHVALEGPARGDGGPLPINAVFFLRHSTNEDGVTLEPVAAADALKDLWALSFSLPTDEDAARCFSSVAALAASVPIWNLSRPLTYDSLPDVVTKVVDAVRGN